MSPWSALFAVPEDANRWTARATGSCRAAWATLRIPGRARDVTRCDLPAQAARCAVDRATIRLAALASPAEAALDAALAMRRALHALNQGWIAAGLAPLDNSIGLEFGEVLYGSVGSTGHRAVTVLGEVVNTAALLEARTRALAVPILMTEALAVALPPARRAALTPLGEVELRRSAPPMAVFGVG